MRASKSLMLIYHMMLPSTLKHSSYFLVHSDIIKNFSLKWYFTENTHKNPQKQSVHLLTISTSIKLKLCSHIIQKHGNCPQQHFTPEFKLNETNTHAMDVWCKIVRNLTFQTIYNTKIMLLLVKIFSPAVRPLIFDLYQITSSHTQPFKVITATDK